MEEDIFDQQINFDLLESIAGKPMSTRIRNALRNEEIFWAQMFHDIPNINPLRLRIDKNRDLLRVYTDTVYSVETKEILIENLGRKSVEAIETYFSRIGMDTHLEQIKDAMRGHYLGRT